MLKQKFKRKHSVGLLILDDNDSSHPRTHEVAIGDIRYDKSSNSNNEVSVRIDRGGSESKYVSVNMPIECFRVFYQLAAAGHIIDLTDYCGYSYKAKKKIEKGDVLYSKLVRLSSTIIEPEDFLQGATAEKEKISLVPKPNQMNTDQQDATPTIKEAGYSADFWRKEQKKLRLGK